jgi:hypothetical protein
VRDAAVSVGWSGAATALPQDATPVALGGSAPHTRLLALGEGVVEAGLLDTALGADLLGDLGFVVAIGVEDPRIEPPTGSEHAPFEFVY